MGGRRARGRGWDVVLAGSLLGAIACSDPGAETYSRALLLKPSTCKECHEDHVREWSGSMHAYAAKDPVFRAMNARGQRDAALGDFCVKCHAPMAVADHLTSDGSNLDDLPEEYQGVTCYFCHQVTSVHGESNNPLGLANDETMRGGITNPVRNKAHRALYSSLHDSNGAESSSLCGSCHDIVVPAHFSGAATDVELERTFSEWKGSLFATSPTPVSCGGCHFATNGGTRTTVASYPGVTTNRVRHQHDFPGVDVALTDFPEKDAQRKAVGEMLTRGVAMTVCVSTDSVATVTLENRGAGHGVPSGAAQDRRMWVELRAYNPVGKDALGDLLYSSGVVPVGSSVSGFVDPDGTSPNVFGDETFDAAGNPTHFFWKAASAQRNGLNVPVTNVMSDTRYHKVGDIKTLTFDVHRLNDVSAHFFQNSGTVKVTLHVQPIGLDVLDAVYDSTVDAATAAEGAAVRAAMPVIDALPDPSSDVTVEWTMQRGLAVGSSVDTSVCLSSGAVK